MRTGAEHYVYRYNVLCVPVAAVLTLQLSGCGVSFSDVPLSMHPLRFLCAALAAWASPSGRLQAASQEWMHRYYRAAAHLIQQYWRCYRLTCGFAVSCECNFCNLNVYPSEVHPLSPIILCDICCTQGCCPRCYPP